MKYCIKCSTEKHDGEFHLGRNVCKICHKEHQKQYRQNNTEGKKEYLKQYRQDNTEAIKKYKKQYYQNNMEKQLVNHARARAKEKNLPFNINEEDIVIPSACPILGIPLEAGIDKGFIQPNSPTLDRIIPQKGYIKGNILVISSRANAMKSNATPEEMIKLGEFGKKLLEEAKKNE